MLRLHHWIWNSDMDLHHFRASVMVYIGAVSSFTSVKERSASFCFVFGLGQWMWWKEFFLLAATPGWHYSSTKQNNFVCLCGCGWDMLTQATHRAAVPTDFFAAFTGRSRKESFCNTRIYLMRFHKLYFYFLVWWFGWSNLSCLLGLHRYTSQTSTLNSAAMSSAPLKKSFLKSGRQWKGRHVILMRSYIYLAFVTTMLVLLRIVMSF